MAVLRSAPRRQRLPTTSASTRRPNSRRASTWRRVNHIATVSDSGEDRGSALYSRCATGGWCHPGPRIRKIGNRLINARVETAAEKPSFRTALRRRRCLVPADGFYEWAGSKSPKQPYYIGLEGRALFAFAGLWERWGDPEGEPLESCTLLTTASAEHLRAVHHRMPVIVDPADYACIGWIPMSKSPISCRR